MPPALANCFSRIGRIGQRVVERIERALSRIATVLFGA